MEHPELENPAWPTGSSRYAARVSDTGEPEQLDGGARPLKPNAIKRGRMLAELAVDGNVTRAAAAAGIDRSTHYDWLKSDATYALQARDAEEQAADHLELELLTRARDRWEDVKPPEGKKRVRGSDLLLIFLLKGLRPWKYRDNQKPDAEGTGPEVLGWEVRNTMNDLANEVLAERERERTGS